MRASQEPAGLVLIVEDNRNISEMVGEFLEGRGFEVDYASDGLDGYRLASENSYDVVVLDLMLPRLDGVEVCKRLREDARKSTPVLMLTARDTLDEKLTGLSAGADDYLTKPFAIQELEARLRALIRRERRQVGSEVLTVADANAYGLRRRLRFAFVLQVTLASLVIVLGAYGALAIAKQAIAKGLLKEEAANFWQQRAAEPSRTAPDGAILHGYAVPTGASAAALPDELRPLGPGLHNLRDMLVLVERRGDLQLYLTYPQSRIDRIALQLVATPLLLLLLAIARSSWLTYRLARRITAPLQWLAQEVRRWDPRDPDSSALAPDKLPIDAGIETRQLAGALQRMGER